MTLKKVVRDRKQAEKVFFSPFLFLTSRKYNLGIKFQFPD